MTDKKISLTEQIRASQAMYQAALENIEFLTDNELGLLLNRIASADTVARVLSIASAGTVARVLSIASADTVDRVLSIASADTVARVLSIASADTVARIGLIKSIVVPVVLDLDKKIAEVASAGNLDMSMWHCGTTHCRAGWAIVFGGEDGSALEKLVGSELAGRLIYEASTGRPAPNFFDGNDAAMEDILRRAAGA